MGDGNSFPLVVCAFQVILAYESIVLCMCSGNVLLDIYLLPKKQGSSLSLSLSLYKLLTQTSSDFPRYENVLQNNNNNDNNNNILNLCYSGASLYNV